MAIPRAVVAITVGVLAAACGGAPPAPAGTVLVSAAVSLSDALEEVADAYAQASGRQVVLNLGPSNAIARQIIAGAPSDVFISADAHQMRRVEDAGRVDPRDRFDLLTNRLAVVVAREVADPPTSPRDLLRPVIRRVALGDPAAVPAGVYWREYLESEGVWNELAPRLVPVSSVRAALAAVEHGAAAAALVFRTDALVGRRARLAFDVPPAEAPPVVYPVAVVEQAPNPSGAGRFVAYLRGPDARAIFEGYGFGVIRGEG